PDAEVAELDRTADVNEPGGAASNELRQVEITVSQTVVTVTGREDPADLALGDGLCRCPRPGRGNAHQSFEARVRGDEALDLVDVELIKVAGADDHSVELHLRVGPGDVGLDEAPPGGGDRVLVLLLEDRVLPLVVDLGGERVGESTGIVGRV